MLWEAKQIRDLINKLNYYTKKYDEGTPVISDKEWDSLYFDLIKLEDETGIIFPDSPTQSIHFETVSELKKVTHSHSMLSLAKTKNVDELKEFVKGYDWMAMFKLDGLSCSLTYEDGILVSAETRGNGLMGEDILHNVMVMPSVPKQIPKKGTIVVDGEIICKYSDFIPFSNEYKNPRNFAAGSIRLLDAKESQSRNLTFVAWDLIKGLDDIDFFFWRLEALDAWGFYTVPRVGDAETVEDAIEILNGMRNDEIYGECPIDGYVFRFESQKYYDSLGCTDHHFRGAIAYKFYDDEYETELLDIELSIGRTGILTPVAIFKPIDIDGATVERASLHNISVMNDTIGTHPYVGQKIKVAKMNMIIPQITWADTNDDNVDWDNLIKLVCCPVCGGSLEVEDNNGVITLWCANPNCEGKLINKIDHFCGKKGLDIKGISKATIEKLIDWGWVNGLTDIFRLEQHRTEWISKTGFGEVSVRKILDAINTTKRSTKLESFISALGIPLVGRTISKTIAKEFETYQEFRDFVDTDDTYFWEFEGIGEEIDSSLKNFDYTEADELAEILTFKQPESQEKEETTLAGKVFCITGKIKHWKNRDELKSYIENRGGKVVGSVSSNVTYLINNDATSTSAKNVTAKKLGIPIITEDEFLTNLY